MPKEAKKQKNPLRLTPSVTIGSTPNMSISEIRAALQSDPEAGMRNIQEAIADGSLTWSKVRDLKAMFHALADVQVPVQVDVMGQQRSVMASAFPLLAGGLTVAGFNDAYEAVPTIGQELVRDIEDNKKETQIAGIISLDKNIDRVPEGEDFPEISAGEERFTVKHKRNGRKLTITAEMVEENDVPGIVQRVDALGEIGGELIEEQTLSRVTDEFGSAASPAEPYVLYLNGSGTQLYNSTANNPGTRAPSGTRVGTNALVDTTDLENARTVLAAMKNSRGKRINIPIGQCVLLVPDALVSRASVILNSMLLPGVENENNPWGPNGRYRPMLLSSPKLDDISTTDWYLGMFNRQFKRKWKLRMEYVTLMGDTQAFLDKRVAFQARLAWDVEVGATDYVWVVQSQAS